MLMSDGTVKNIASYDIGTSVNFLRQEEEERFRVNAEFYRSIVREATATRIGIVAILAIKVLEVSGLI